MFNSRFFLKTFCLVFFSFIGIHASAVYCNFDSQNKVSCQITVNELSDISNISTYINDIVSKKGVALDETKGVYVYFDSDTGDGYQESIAKKITVDLHPAEGDKISCSFDEIIDGDCNTKKKISSIQVVSHNAPQADVGKLTLVLEVRVHNIY